jgi:hypothetical protein
MGASNIAEVRETGCRKDLHREKDWLAHVPPHILHSLTKCRCGIQSHAGTQELMRHSSLRSTLNVYTQAVTPAKHEAQAAVLSLVFPSLVARSEAELPPHSS